MTRRVRERPAGRPSLRALPTPPLSEPPLDGSREFADLYGEIPELSDPPLAPTSLSEPEPEPAAEVAEPPAAGQHPRPHQARRVRRTGP
jgi:hypothetical protein